MSYFKLYMIIFINKGIDTDVRIIDTSIIRYLIRESFLSFEANVDIGAIKFYITF